MTETREYFFNESAMTMFENPDAVLARMEQGETFQQILGFSADAMLDFYAAAQGLLRQERWEEAANAFIFLTTLNPFMTEFWLGLGWAELQQGHYEEALIPFKWAVVTKPTEIEPYQFAVECCLLKGDRQQAAVIAHHAMEVGRSDEQWRSLLRQAEELGTYIARYPRGG